MKTFITTFLLTISLLNYGQTTFYKANGEKVKVIGEQTTLKFNSISLSVDKPEKFAGTLIASLLPSIIDLGFKVSSDIIENNLQKYTNDFSARNTYRNSDFYISGFEISRKVLKKGESNTTEAFNLSVVPLQVNDNTFVFAVDNILTMLSGAKSKPGLNYNDYMIEIKLTYFNGKEKKEQSSSPINISMLSIDQKNYGVKNETPDEYLYVSDKFPFNPEYSISEVSVKIIETNSSKVRAEKIKNSYDKYSEDIKDIAKNIINFYIDE